MPDRPKPAPDDEPLSRPVATRVLARASELDALHAAETTVADLRAAAQDAGISRPAFDAALAEQRGAEQPQVLGATGQRRRRSRRWVLAAAFAVLTVTVIALNRAPVGTVDAAAPIVEEAFVLRCLSPGEAAELIRPLLRLPANTVVYSPARAPRVLTIRGTPEQIRDVRAALDRYESPGSAACATSQSPR